MDILFRGHDTAGFFIHALDLRQGNKLTTLLPDNKRTDDSRYVCVYSVRDFWRMDASRDPNKEWHYSFTIEADILTDIRAGRAVLLFDFCNEGPPFWGKIFNDLFDWIEANNLGRGRVIWLSQNRAIQADVLNRYGEKASFISFVSYDFFIKAFAWRFSTYSGANIFGQPSENNIEKLLSVDEKDKYLLCLNATPRLNRILTVSFLRYQGLLDKCLVSFPGFDYAKPGSSIEEALIFIQKNSILSKLSDDVKSLATLGQLSVDHFAETGNDLVTKIDIEPYKRTFFSLVTESDFSDGASRRITEKTIKPFCLGHPALVVGNPASLNFMAEFGFDIWENLIDRSAESIFDPQERFIALTNEINRIIAYISDHKNVWATEIRTRGLKNIYHAISGDFLSRYISKYDEAIVRSLEALIAA